MAFGLCCGDGWFRIIDEICNTLQTITDGTAAGVKLKVPVEKIPPGAERSYVVSTEFMNYPQIEFAQIKEKFGRLRIYTDVVPPSEEMLAKYDEQSLNEHWTYGANYLRGVVRHAEVLSGITCECCGNPGKLMIRGGYYKTVCAECSETQGFKEIERVKSDE